MLDELHHRFIMKRLVSLLSTFDALAAGEPITWMDAISRCAQTKATIENFECICCTFAACICDSLIVDGAIAVEFELVDLGDRGRDKTTAEQTNAWGPPLSGALPEAQPFVVALRQGSLGWFPHPLLQT